VWRRERRQERGRLVEEAKVLGLGENKEEWRRV